MYENKSNKILPTTKIGHSESDILDRMLSIRSLWQNLNHKKRAIQSNIQDIRNN